MSAAAVIVFASAVVFLVGLIMLGVPIAFALIGTAGLGLAIASGTGVASAEMSGAAFNATADYALAVVPLFVLMGSLA